jgi:PAS domain S-box-containing protein
VAQTAVAIVITDAAGRILHVNPAFEQLTGYSAAEALSQTPRILKSGAQSPAFYAEIWSCLTAGHSWHGQIRNRRKDGTFYVASLVISPVRDAAGRTVNYVGMQRDVTQERALEEHRRDAQQMQAISRLIGGIAHDFNTMLAIIRSNAELLHAELPAGPPAALSLRDILDAAERSAELVHKLLAFTRQEQLQFQLLDASTVVAGLEEELRQILPAAVTLQLEPGSAIPPFLGDRATLEKAVLTLVDNALEAMPHGGKLTILARSSETEVPDPRPANRWVEAPRGPSVQIEVSDTGVGMEPAALKRVFEPFFTAKAPGTGVGLGLSFVYGLVKQHSGYVNVFSAPGRGTTVRVHFPLADHAPAALPLSRPPREAGDHRQTVLVVEDEEPLRRVTRRSLERLGYAVHEAADGQEGLELYSAHEAEIALIITDVVMPRLSGTGLWRALRKRGARVPFLFVSGYAREQVGEEVHADPLVSHLAKPWTLPELGERVRLHLAQTAPETPPGATNAQPRVLPPG